MTFSDVLRALVQAAEQEAALSGEASFQGPFNEIKEYLETALKVSEATDI